MNRDSCPRIQKMETMIGVHEAPCLLKEGGGVMKRNLSESLTVNLPAITNKYLAFLTSASCSGRTEVRGFRMNKKGGEKQFVSDQEITKEEKYIVTLIRRMEVKQ